MKALGKAELKELLIKCWMTHDGMWLMHTARHCGFEKANLINKAAVRSMAKIEMARITKAFGIEQVRTMAEFRNLLSVMDQVVKAEFMDFHYTYPREDTLRVHMNRCFAYDGMARLGALDQYECGIFERFFGWLDALGIGYQAIPEVKKCLMHETGSCVRDLLLKL